MDVFTVVLMSLVSFPQMAPSQPKAPSLPIETPPTQTPVELPENAAQWLRAECWDHQDDCLALMGFCSQWPAQCEPFERVYSELLFGPPKAEGPTLVAFYAQSDPNLTPTTRVQHRHHTPPGHFDVLLSKIRRCHHGQAHACRQAAAWHFWPIEDLWNTPKEIALYIRNYRTELLRWAVVLHSSRCHRGDLDSCFEVGDLKTGFLSSTPDPVGGFRYFDHACSKGHMRSCGGAGSVLWYGLGVEQDLDEAERRLRQSCSQGYECTALALVLMYGAPTCREPSPYEMSKQQLESTQEGVAILAKACKVHSNRDPSACTIWRMLCDKYDWRACPPD